MSQYIDASTSQEASDRTALWKHAERAADGDEAGEEGIDGSLDLGGERPRQEASEAVRRWRPRLGE